MKIFLKAKEFIGKLQNLPTKQKMIILWSVVVLLGVIMGFFWIKGIGEKIKSVDSNKFIKELIPPSVGEKIQEIEQQKINIQEEVEKLEDDQEILETFKKLFEEDLTPEEMQELERELQEKNNDNSN